MADNPSTPLKLPLGLADFVELITENFYYADKTRLLYEIVKDGMAYLLTRPRRFGKSLLVSTLATILRGRRELFKGLWIDGSDYDWRPYPVIYLDMIDARTDDPANTSHCLSHLVQSAAEAEEVKVDYNLPTIMLINLIEELYEKFGKKNKVAVLIDEYDAPIVRHISSPRKAEEVREKLFDFYIILKARQDQLGHVFLTGVSRFGQTTIFSGLNHLIDLTLDDKFATICGFTQADLDDIIERDQDRALNALIERQNLPKGSTRDDLRRLLRDWYSGYTWDGQTIVYNPWSIVNFFYAGQIGSYWMDSGNITSIEKLFKSGQAVYDLGDRSPIITSNDNSIAEIEDIKPEVLLFQTGYLTVHEQVPVPMDGYILGFPNNEVAEAILPLVNRIEPPQKNYGAIVLACEIRDSLLDLDREGLQKSFGEYLALMTFDLHEATEKFYYSHFLMAMSFSGQPLVVQRHAPHGITDLRVKGRGDDQYVLEFKLFKEKQNSSGNYPKPPTKPEEMARLRELMAPLANEAMGTINEKYPLSLVRGPGRLVKVSMVIARRVFVLAQFEAVQRDPA